MLVELDVSELEPPLPMQTIINALADLTHGQILKVFHRREPVPLYRMLAEQGMTWYHQQVADGQHIIYIWQLSDIAASDFISQTIRRPS